MRNGVAQVTDTCPLSVHDHDQQRFACSKGARRSPVSVMLGALKIVSKELGLCKLLVNFYGMDRTPGCPE